MSQFLTLLLLIILSTVAIQQVPLVSCRQWCMAMRSATNEQLQSNIDFACSNGVDCSPIKPSGSCFEPNNMVDHASFVMNAYYHSHGRTVDACRFGGTSCFVFVDPSYDSCVYYT
ncbi:hypothetical protein EUTSA_v10005350mg [Eutrema salsugineum]|uniref:X8 domain-containing protein n=1 Tax=Eutrema salsugineum TaxID=72664 RepID=V4KK71_EUTSA|nr:major pollen allergen Ole e 10 [Eutrema salsugineum]ESQ31584.1 hypothetical protein EUTSA_v10005350mg [Eutrema salsugineum]